MRSRGGPNGERTWPIARSSSRLRLPMRKRDSMRQTPCSAKMDMPSSTRRSMPRRTSPDFYHTIVARLDQAPDDAALALYRALLNVGPRHQELASDATSLQQIRTACAQRPRSPCYCRHLHKQPSREEHHRRLWPNRAGRGPLGLQALALRYLTMHHWSGATVSESSTRRTDRFTALVFICRASVERGGQNCPPFN